MIPALCQHGDGGKAGRSRCRPVASIVCGRSANRLPAPRSGPTLNRECSWYQVLLDGRGRRCYPWRDRAAGAAAGERWALHAAVQWIIAGWACTLKGGAMQKQWRLLGIVVVALAVAM